MARSSPRAVACSTSPGSAPTRPRRAIVRTMRRGRSPSTGCRSAPTSPPAPSIGFPVLDPQIINQIATNQITREEHTTMSDIADPNQPETGTAELPDPRAEEEIEQIEEDFEASGPLVGIIMGSKNDMEKMLPAEKYLSAQGIKSEVHVMSAHRDPEKVREYCQNARMNGLKVIIAGAGMSAVLSGVAVAHTDLSVIGVPILGKSLGGFDALFSAVQMPPGIPVA